MMVSFFSIALNFFFNWLFIFHLKMGHKGLALSTAFSATINFGLLYFFMTRFTGSLYLRELWSTVWRCGVASLPMIAVVLMTQSWLAHLTGMPVLIRMAGLLLVIVVAVSLFAGSCILLKIEGISEFLKILRNKWGRFFFKN